MSIFGNTVFVQDNGLVIVTPERGSTRVMTQKEVCDACKKQTPEKPKPLGLVFVCPSCYAGINEEYGKPAFCDKCGQAFDWSDFIDLP